MKLFLSRVLGFLIDFAIIYTLMQVSSFFWWNTTITSVILSFAYSVFGAFNNGKSLGRECMNLQLEYSTHFPSNLKIFFRDFVLQWGVYFILPFSISKILQIHLNVLYLLGFIFGINLFCWIFCKKTPIDMLTKTNWILKPRSKKKTFFPSFLLTVSAFFIDLTTIYSITLIMERIINHFLFVETIVLFFATAFVYSLTSYYLAKNTVGQWFVGLKLILKNKEKLSLTTLLKRELVYKFGLGLIIPLTILLLLSWNDLYYMSIPIIIFNLIIAFVYYVVKKEFWWDTLAKTQKIKAPSLHLKVWVKYLILIAIWGSTYGFLVFQNNYQNPSKHKILGFNHPFKFKEYPNNYKLQKYDEFLSTPLQSAEDYILDLFNKYDIVILCEYIHLEDNQWDMIYSIVSNPNFILKVGNIFTEYGSTENQNVVDGFLQTSYSNDTALEKATATLMNYQSGNFYYFMKKLNLLNKTLPDSLKIREHFTDILPWKYIHSYKKPFFEREAYLGRDSLMAQTVIDWYRKYRKKCLVVTDYRHAFAINQEVQKIQKDTYKRFFFGNEAQYIYNEFPKATANVLINGLSLKRVLPEPIQKGKWERIFKKEQGKSIGFNFENSPFGDDSFDFYPTKGKRINIKYKDIFTGFVFYKPMKESKSSSPKYQRYAAEQELAYALKYKLVDSIGAKEDISRYENFCDKPDLSLDYMFLYHYLDIIAFIMLLTISFPIATWHLIRRFRKR